MKRHRTAEQIGDLNIEIAASLGTPSRGVGGIDDHFILNVPRLELGLLAGIGQP